MKIKKPRGPTEMTLNITSMMDMFTIILVFLLFSFKAQDETFSMAKGIKLPGSSSNLELQDALNIQMAADALIVQEQAVLPLRGGRLPPDAPIEGHKILPLYEVIVAEGRLRKAKLLAEGRKDEAEANIVVLQADKRVRFADVDKVMKTAAMAGFPNFRFAVMKQ